MYLSGIKLPLTCVRGFPFIEREVMMKDYKKYVHQGETETKVKFKIKPMYDMPSDFDLKGIDPISELTRSVSTKSSNDLDKYIFSQLDTDYNYAHVEEVQIRKLDFESNSTSYKMSYRMIATHTIDRVFDDERDVIDLQDLRTTLYQMGIDYKNMSYEECSSIVGRMKV